MTFILTHGTLHGVCQPSLQDSSALWWVHIGLECVLIVRHSRCPLNVRLSHSQCRLKHDAEEINIHLHWKANYCIDLTTLLLQYGERIWNKKPVLSVCCSTALSPPLRCGIQSRPPQQVWAEHRSPLTCGCARLHLLQMLDTSLLHFILNVFCLLGMSYDQAVAFDCPITQNVENQLSAVAIPWWKLAPSRQK